MNRLMFVLGGALLLNATVAHADVECEERVGTSNPCSPWLYDIKMVAKITDFHIHTWAGEESPEVVEKILSDIGFSIGDTVRLKIYYDEYLLGSWQDQNIEHSLSVNGKPIGGAFDGYYFEHGGYGPILGGLEMEKYVNIGGVSTPFYVSGENYGPNDYVAYGRTNYISGRNHRGILEFHIRGNAYTFYYDTEFPGRTDPVPEPATWALMISGFGLIGGALRRRNCQPETTTS